MAKPAGKQRDAARDSQLLIFPDDVGPHSALYVTLLGLSTSFFTKYESASA